MAIPIYYVGNMMILKINLKDDKRCDGCPACFTLAGLDDVGCKLGFTIKKYRHKNKKYRYPVFTAYRNKECIKVNG